MLFVPFFKLTFVNSGLYFDAIYVNSLVDVVLVKKCILNFAIYHMYVQLKKNYEALQKQKVFQQHVCMCILFVI